jgi:inorganic pyrophosphatase
MTMPVSFDILVKRPHSDANEYAYDESARALRLQRVVRVDSPAFADHGVVVGSVTPRGEPLHAWLLSDVPNSPEALVSARAVGALEHQRNGLVEQVVIAVPLVDARYARVSEFNTLPARHRAALQRILEESTRWLDASSAEELIHLARQRARLAQVHKQNGARVRPAWEMGSDCNYVEHLARETTLHTQAEAALFTVPYRFQMYLRLCLTPTERILYWVHRPWMRIGGIARWGGQVAREGLLVLTDQQCLWMEDPVTPTVPVEGGYGYVARSQPVEQTADATVVERADRLLLRLTSTNRRGEPASLEIPFPISAREELHQVAGLLCAFTPRPGDRRLRRVASPRPGEIQLDDPMEDDPAKTAPVVAELQKGLSPQLNGATIYAQAFVPAWAEGGAQLLTVTDRKIYLTAGHARSDENPIVYDVSTMIAPEICFSVLGSWLRVLFPGGQMLQVRFPLTALKGFNTCWLMLRQLSTLGMPITDQVQMSMGGRE